MTTSQPHKVLTIKNAALELANSRDVAAVFTEFADAVDEVTVNVKFDTSEWVPVSGKNQRSVGEPVYEIALNVGQDLTEGALFMFLTLNHGKLGKAVVYPKGGVTPKIEADVVLTIPNAIGGKVGVATAGAVLPVDGTPVITPEAAA